MTLYDIRHVCDPLGDLTLEKPMRYVDLFRWILDIDELESDRKSVTFSREWLQEKLDQHLQELEADKVLRDAPRLGLNFCLTGRQAGKFEFDLFSTFGTEPGSPFRADASGFAIPVEFVRDAETGHQKVRRLLEGGVHILKPFYAGVEESNNRRRLAAYRLAKKYPWTTRPSQQVEPVLIHWLTYLRHDLVEAFGGSDHVRETPSHRVYELEDGLVIELTENPVCDSDKEHCDIQIEAMKHLHIPYQI